MSSSCPAYGGLTNSEYLRAFQAKAGRLRVPLMGSVDLTRRCNLRCGHCYHGPLPPEARPVPSELCLEEWKRVLDEAGRAGCLFLLLTGGEPLLRREFGDVYRHAAGLGMLLTVFTNGTLVTPEVLELFGEIPPRSVEITIYGATDRTHDAVTGVRGSFAASRRGIEALLGRGVRLKLKTILMAENRHEFEGMESLAEAYGVQFRMDAGVFPRLDGDRGPLGMRVGVEDAVALEMSSAWRERSWREYFGRARTFPAADKLYACGCGLSSFHIDADGWLRPCLMVTEVRYDLRAGTFQDGWERVIPQVRAIAAPAGYACNRCEDRAACSVCPGFFRLENGDPGVRSGYLCALGRERARWLRSMAEEGTGAVGSAQEQAQQGAGDGEENQVEQAEIEKAEDDQEAVRFDADIGFGQARRKESQDDP